MAEIVTRQQLKYYIMADSIMNRGYNKRGLSHCIKELLFPDYIMRYLREMRKVSYYSHKSGIIGKLNWGLHFLIYRKLGLKLGFSIGCDSCGYGLLLPHNGSVIVGNSNRVGNFAVLFPGSNITDNGKTIGNALYLSAGAKITGNGIILGNNISIAANSVVTKSYESDNILLAGMPAEPKKITLPWYVRDGQLYLSREKAVELIKELNEDI